MTKPTVAAVLVLILTVSLTGSQAPGTRALAMTLDVDATDAPLKILHATMTMPARPGAMTLFYPKWIPGEHMPSGPIANLTGLHVFADGAEVPWRWDLVEMNALGINVPAGARTLTAKYDYVVPFAGGAFGSLPSTNAKIAVINWYTVGLYPMGDDPSAITVTPTLKAPAGWKHGGSLDVAAIDGNTIRYAPTSLEMLNDHPVLLGEHFRSITLWPADSPVGEHVIDVVADSDWALQFPQQRIDAYNDGIRDLLGRATQLAGPDREVIFNGIDPGKSNQNVQLLDYTTGALSEYFCIGAAGKLADVATTWNTMDSLAIDKKLFLRTNFPDKVSDEKRALYGRFCTAEFLMAWKPGLDYFQMGDDYTDKQLANDPQMLSVSLGDPTGQMQSDGNISIREFANGWVAINTGNKDDSITAPAAGTSLGSSKGTVAVRAKEDVTVPAGDAVFVVYDVGPTRRAAK